AVARENDTAAAPCPDTARRVLARPHRCNLGSKPGQHTAPECPRRRLHDRRRTRQSRAISAADDHSRPRPGQRDRTRQCLRAALGNRERLRRTQIPSARTSGGAALEVPAAGAAGDVGAPMLPLRHPHAHARRRDARRARPRSNILRRGAAYHPKIVVPQLFFPLTTVTLSPPSGSAPSGNSPNVSIQHAAPAPTHGWSNAKSSNRQPNAPTTRDGRNRPTAHRSLFNYLTERYWS